MEASEPKWVNLEKNLSQVGSRHKCVKGLLSSDFVKLIYCWNRKLAFRTIKYSATPFKESSWSWIMSMKWSCWVQNSFLWWILEPPWLRFFSGSTHLGSEASKYLYWFLTNFPYFWTWRGSFFLLLKFELSLGLCINKLQIKIMWNISLALVSN